jgi:GT2 family glycosyltransferase
VESIRKLRAGKRQTHIVIVDNASSEETVAKTRQLFGQDSNVSLVFNTDNLGFAGGNNVGYRYAKEQFGDAFIVVMNNDVVVHDSEFAEKCCELFCRWSYSVLGPDTVTPDRRRENPWNDYVYGIDGWKDLRSLFVRQKKDYLKTGFAAFQRVGERSPQETAIANPILQGACYIFSPIFVHCNKQPFDKASFLYGEEFPLATNCLITGHFMLYSSDLAVAHEEGVSTNLVVDRKKMLHGYNGALSGVELSSLRLERQASAVAGRPLGIDDDLIRKLTSDGRRHVLVDLFFCQPGFHGGGEYGKAVFKGLIKTSLRRPDIQLWAALDPDLFIDEWIWDECRRFAINIVRVKSYDDVVKLVNLSCFYSFFAPAIVVYTGYEYMKQVGSDLRFDELTTTRVVGTLLDLRDFELVSQWEPIAEARRKAGCSPELDFTPKQWEAESARQTKMSQDLGLMYQRICRHKALKTLVTISSHSAQSIKENAQRSQPIEVLFPPEKSRAKPEPFTWHSIDFENDRYLVLLLAGRFEKNAASAVAAFDKLFRDAAFASAHPSLKLVLVGINNIGGVGIKKPQEHHRIINIPHLPPAQLEYLLSKARGLLYPSFNEGFGYPPLEAMSLGVPCVVSDCTSLPEVCGNVAHYCDPLNIDSIASAISSLLAREPNVRAMQAWTDTIKRRQAQDLNRLSLLICGELSPGRSSLADAGAKVADDSGGRNVVFRYEGYCPICEKRTSFAATNDWLRDHYLCSECESLPRERALMCVIQKYAPDWRSLRIHESSPEDRGASRKLRQECNHYIATQFDPDFGFGKVHPSGVYQSEDLERQTFADESFDIVVTQDVMEHVFDADAVFREIFRTLAPGGVHIFTTPLVNKHSPTACRAKRMPNGHIEFLAPAEYHGNPMSREGSLVTWHWGFDIVNVVARAGAGIASVINVTNQTMGIEGEYLEVIVQRKN